MEIIPQIFTAKVMHKRFFPKVNAFTYGAYYLALPLSKLHHEITTENFAINKPGILSFYEKDHGDYQGNLHGWVNNILKDNKLDNKVSDIILIAMPRILGYVFNPVSFYFFLDEKANLRAVLCEVNNTFGETHSYLCANKNGSIINSDDWLEANKLFHVSPFLEREGYYKFRFSLKDNKLGIWIDFYNKDAKKQLVTSLVGSLQPLTKSNLRKAVLKHPLVSLKTIFLIHWQAIKLIAKGIKYIPKPKQLKERLSHSGNIKKM